MYGWVGLGSIEDLLILENNLLKHLHVTFLLKWSSTLLSKYILNGYIYLPNSVNWEFAIFSLMFFKKKFSNYKNIWIHIIFKVPAV